MSMKKYWERRVADFERQNKKNKQIIKRMQKSIAEFKGTVWDN
tara:strand:+ start:331 stop:459 length:129 start_codon:yes stop_codon:yes gene_type:complete